jgi:DNA replication protein DnaC
VLPSIQNGFVTLFTTAAELIEDLPNASRRGHLQESLTNYTHPHVLVIVEVGYLTYGPDAANVLFQGERSAPEETADDLHHQQATE